MNDFENELKKQPIRRVPEHWRAPILREADWRGRSPAQDQAWWTMLLWPSPKAWATLAAAWVVILACSVATRESSAPEPKAQATQIRMAMEEKRRLQAEVEEASLRLDQQPKPRSEAIRDSKSA